MINLITALVAARKQFSPVIKTKLNPFHKSTYADLASCIKAIETPLLDNGLIFIQRTASDDTGVTVETVFLHVSGERLECGSIHMPASRTDKSDKPSAQGFGSALTYARRYSLCAACGIAPDDDDDGNGANGSSIGNKDRGRHTLTRGAGQDREADAATGPTAEARRIEQEFKRAPRETVHMLRGWDEQRVEDLWDHLTNDTQNSISTMWTANNAQSI